MFSFKDKVFVNCPYDNEYKEFFLLLVYFCVYFSCEPCFASEDYSSSSRTDKIIEMIKESSIAIHDISRVTLTNNLPRFNMPFELGMDYFYAKEVNKKKRVLVLDGSDNDYRKSLSDLNCSDISAHNNDQKKFVDILRHFFIGVYKLENTPSSNILLREYKILFMPWLNNNLKCNGLKRCSIEMGEFKNKVILYFSSHTQLCC